MSGVSFKIIDSNSNGQRLDNFLMKSLKGVPRSKIYQIIRKGEVRVNGKRKKPADKLNTGDEVRVPPVRVAESNGDAQAPGWVFRILEHSVVTENDDYLVINKPDGIAVHGGSGIAVGLIEALRLARPDEYFELVHRLDRATSGVLLIAKNREALLAANTALADASKCYDVLVYGYWPDGVSTVETRLDKVKDASGEGRMLNTEHDGKLARTRFNVVQRFDGYTLLTAELDSGRTHQIRAHCLFHRCAIVGDEKYAEKSKLKQSKKAGIKRMFLHARHLSMRGVGEFEAPLPEKLSNIISKLNEAEAR